MQHGRRQRGCGRLAAGAGYGQNGFIVQIAPGQFHFSQNFRVFHVHQPIKAGHGHAGARHHKGGVFKLRRTVRPQFHNNAKLPQFAGQVFTTGKSLGIAVQKAHARALTVQKPRSRKTGTSRADHHGRFTNADASTAHFFQCHSSSPQRSFRTESAMRPKSIDVIQKRIMILDSGTPLSSK